VLVFMCNQFELRTDLQSSNNRKCLRVKSGDRLGIYSEFDMSAVSYQYTTNPAHVTNLIHIFSENDTQPDTDNAQPVIFDSVVYPYQLFAVAYYYNGKISFIYFCIFVNTLITV